MVSTQRSKKKIVKLDHFCRVRGENFEKNELPPPWLKIMPIPKLVGLIWYLLKNPAASDPLKIHKSHRVPPMSASRFAAEMWGCEDNHTWQASQVQPETLKPEIHEENPPVEACINDPQNGHFKTWVCKWLSCTSVQSYREKPFPILSNSVHPITLDWHV